MKIRDDIYEQIEAIPTELRSSARITEVFMRALDRALASQRVDIAAALVDQSSDYAEAGKDQDLSERMKHYYRGKSSGLMRASIVATDFEGGV